MKVCTVCNNEYGGSPTKKYCSSKCRNKRYYQEKQYTDADRIRSRYLATKSRAKSKGLKFDLSMDDFLKLICYGRCHYCKEASDKLTLDRCVPANGYTISNLVGCCRNCNTVKNNILTYEEMLQLSKLTSNNPLGLRTSPSN